MIEELAVAIYNRPWGIGFASFCLLTGDVPVLVLNGQDHDDQQAAVRYWDLYLPLDPHRCLYLAGCNSKDDKYRSIDHRFTLHVGHARALNSLMIDTAVRHVFFHPEHDPTELTEPALRSTHGLPQLLVHYETLSPGYGIERRWLDRHPDPSPRRSPQLRKTEALKRAKEMSEEIERRQELFRRFNTEPK